MKIAEVRIVRRVVRFEPKYKCEVRPCASLDVYTDDQWDREREREKAMARSAPALIIQEPSPRNGVHIEKTAPGTISGLFVSLITDEGLTGECGPLSYRSEMLAIMDDLAPRLIGQNPLKNRRLWDEMSRCDGHGRSGVMMMAISALDVALWDLKGKILGQP